jgi:hypothetical protein
LLLLLEEHLLALQLLLLLLVAKLEIELAGVPTSSGDSRCQSDGHWCPCIRHG